MAPFPSRSLDGGIDEVPLVAGVHGRLWLCGKHVVGPDPECALARVGATSVVCLTEAHELSDRYPEYVSWLRVHDGRRAVWFPIPDLHAPPAASAEPFVDGLATRLRNGEGLVVHCGAGIGRAGTAAVAVLMRFGLAPDAAVARVREHRPMAGPEAGAQVELVRELAARWGR